jgi:hypothetical protein
LNVPVLTNYPTLPSGAKPDSAQFSEKRADIASASSSEDDYEFTRPRHTRAPGRTWQVAYRELTAADYNTLNAFWDTVKSGAIMFNWVNPSNGVSYIVRFKGEMEWTYVGVGATKRWDCRFTLKQV